MKKILLVLSFFSLVNQAQAQKITADAIAKFQAKGLVQYSDFGAKGDGKTDDSNAIVATHAFANQHGLPVRADQDATYYIGGSEHTAIIQTDTDFGTASFLIDDTDVENNKAPVFQVSSSLEAFKLSGVSSLKRNQKRIKATLPGPCLITVTNAKVKQYIRYGLNQNNGSAQTDIFVVDKKGKVDMDAPIIWDFQEITKITAQPIDEITLKISGGRFTTIANQEPSKYNYYNRNIAIRRSNVIVDGLEHRITGEGEHGAPYSGFLNIGECAYVTIQNVLLTGHKTYRTIGSAKKPVSMGSYDLLINRALNVSVLNTRQTTNIDDRKYWGLMGSNYCKNLYFDNCTFSRFDAHKGVANVTIRNCTFGHMGLKTIGTGTFLVENTTVRGRGFIDLRQDYGSTWEGKFIIRDCTFIPAAGSAVSASLINGFNSGQHDFGYTCYMPEQIIIENLHIDDSNHPTDYQGPAIFSNFNKQFVDAAYVEQFPYVKTKKVLLKNVTTASGKTLRISDNPAMFKEVKVKIR
ncbi:MAG: hypothetical protein Sapg2KO_39680 [Saprospiraceae bacterium]